LRHVPTRARTIGLIPLVVVVTAFIAFTAVDASDAKEFAQLEIQLTEAISAAELEAFLDSTCTTLEERRRVGVTLLKEHAKASQAKLMSNLRDLERRGLARDVRSKWLTNRIAVSLEASQVPVLTGHQDVQAISQPPQYESLKPEFVNRLTSGLALSETVEENLEFIGADSAWKMGFTGEGRIVCHFDAVYGRHPCIFDQWKGHDGDTSAAWNPYYISDSAFPYSPFDHGTQVMSVMVGHDPIRGDTMGVAPGAKWIVSSLTDFEWAADPDGDPATTADVPDVICFTSGANAYCNRWWYDEVDMVEALGTVVIWAAGNNGSEMYSVIAPANRAEDSLTNFAVGSVDHRNGLVRWSSSRGPSTCDSISIKPNVCAPGVAVKTALSGGGYALAGGTSFAAPHVAGAVAILRQYAPNSTSREIKEALIAGCMPSPIPNPNNHYGWGTINIPASIEFLSSDQLPDIRVKRFSYLPVNVEDTIMGFVTLTNRGYQADSIWISFSSEIEGLQVLSDSLFFGSIANSDSSAAHTALRMLFVDTVFAGPVLVLPCDIYSGSNHLRRCSLYVQAGIPGERQYFNHESPHLRFTVSNYGEFGFSRWDDYILRLPGFRYKDAGNSELITGSVMIAVDETQVSDVFFNEELDNDDDFWIDAAAQFEVMTPGSRADQETRAVFDDGRAEGRIGIQLTQTSMSWDADSLFSFVVLEYEFCNQTEKYQDELMVGMCFDWYHFRERYCLGYFEHSDDLGVMACPRPRYPYNRFDWYRSVAVLNEEGTHSHRMLSYRSANRDPAEPISEAAKYRALVDGIEDSVSRVESGYSMSQLVSTGPFFVAAGRCDTAAFVVLAGESYEQLRLARDLAADRYKSTLPAPNPPPPLPTTTEIMRIYPNPFNAATRIEFALSSNAHVRLDIFNVLGQRVATAADRIYPVGRHAVTWSGDDFSSGIYFAKLSAQGRISTKRLVLVK